MNLAAQTFIEGAWLLNDIPRYLPFFYSFYIVVENAYIKHLLFYFCE